MLDLAISFFTDISNYLAFAAGWVLVKQPQKVQDFYGFISKKLDSYRK